jgi:hypothetical protein
MMDEMELHDAPAMPPPRVGGGPSAKYLAAHGIRAGSSTLAAQIAARKAAKPSAGEFQGPC